MTDLATAPNDLGAPYAASVQTTSALDVQSRLRALAGEAEPAAEGAATATRDRPPQLITPGGTAPVVDGVEADLHVIVNGDEAQQAPPDRAGWIGDAVDAAGRVARNVGDAAKQTLIGGPLGALREVFRAADDIGNFLTGTAPVAEGDATMAANPGRAIANAIPQVAPPDTPAGKVALEISQFLAGFIGGGRAIRGAAGAATSAAGRTAQAMGAGAIADFFASDPNRARLAELWQSSGLPANALTDYLADRGDDSGAEARMKQATEGLVVGGALEGLMAAARGFRAATRVRETQGGAQASRAQAEAAAAAEREQQGALVRDALAALGNPERSAPLITMGPPAPLRAVQGAAGDPAARMAAGEAGQAAAGPDAARALAGAASERLRAFEAPTWIRGDLQSEAEVMARGEAADASSLPGGVRDLLEAMRRGRIGPRGEVSLISFFVKNGGIRESRGDLQAVMGSVRARPGLMNNRSGMTLDQAVEAARAAGYFDDVAGPMAGREAENLAGKLATSGRGAETLTQRDLLDAMDEELRGNGVRYGRTADAGGRDVAAAADDLEQALDAAGLTMRDSDADIAAALFGRGGAEVGAPDLAAETAARMAGKPAAGSALPSVENTTTIRSATDPGEVFVNFARIDAPEDVQAVLRDMADAFRPEINDAARGVQSNEATKKLADDLGLTVEQLLSRRPGEPLNAETALAARRLLTASAEKLTGLAAAAAAPNAAPAAEYAFRRMMAVHYAIQAEVLAARRETARALQAWAIPAGSGAEQARSIQQMLEQHGGVETAQVIARRMVALQQAGANPAAIGGFIAQGAFARTASAVQEFWINALLSSPKTHLVNMGSNAFVAAQQVLERRVAEAIPGSDVASGEAAAMAYGLVTGLRDAWRLAGRSYRDGTGEVGQMLGKVDVPHDRAISSQAFGADPGSGLGRALDFIGHSVVNAPSRALGAEDAFFKSVGYRMEMHAGALRTATDEALSAGTHTPGTREFAQDVAARMGRLIANPPEALRLQAADQALYQTFNRDTYGGPVQVVRGLMGLREKIPGLTFILPFIRTPANVISYSFERTPLAPLVGQWRADVAAGGARRDLALARVAVGTTAMAMAFDMADRGQITGRGPDDAGETENLRNQGIPAYSIRVGNSWVSYDRADPLGFLFGFAADAADMLRRRDIEPEEVDEVGELIAAGITTVARSVVDKTWMQGVAGVIEALDQPERGAARFLQQFAGSFVPALVGQTEQAISPARSEANSVTDAVLARIPVLSDRLSPRRNRWGEVIVPDSPGRAAFDAFSPLRVTDLRDSPADAELQRLNLGIERIPKRTDFDGAQVNLGAYPGAYDDYVRLAGNDWQNPATGKGLRDSISEMVQGEGPFGATYAGQSDGRDGGKALMIKTMVQQFRQGARQALLQMPEHADLAAVIGARQVERIQNRTPPSMR